MSKEYQYVVMDGSVDELILVDMDTETGEYRESFQVVVPDRDVCFAVVPRDGEMPSSILRHGPRDNILAYIEKNNEILRRIPMPLLQFESARDNGWTLEEINRIITTTHYIDTLIREKDAVVVENVNE